MKELLFTKVFTLRRLFLWGNVLLLILFLIVLAKDNERGWKDYQKEYKKRELSRAQNLVNNAVTDDEKKVAKATLIQAKKQPLEIRQTWVPELAAVDRCITCHLGHDGLVNPTMTTPYDEHPFKAPADQVSFDIHKAHDPLKFGCVTCHGGQGLATEKQAAHGFIDHWENPLRTGIMLQASCVQCHDNREELIFNGKLYTSEVVRAESLFREFGCIGCHQIGGEGGPISVDLKSETSNKPLSRIDFSYTGLPHEERTLENWIKIHFLKDPVTFVPGDPTGEFSLEPIAPSGMPAYIMPESDADALTAFILGLNQSGIPPEYRVLSPPKEKTLPKGKIARGRWVYEEYGCAGCHGKDARGGIRNYNYVYDTMPNLRRAVATYTRNDLKEKISDGVPFVAKHAPLGPNPPLYMPPWKNKISPDQMDDLVSYLLSIKE